MTRTAQSIKQVVSSGLCIGCGLCEAVSNGSVKMTMTTYGSLRPTPLDALTPAQEAQLVAACPGITVEPRLEDGLQSDAVWGAYSDMRYAWAGDADIRYRAATGGVLTALGVHLLQSEKASFILHVGPDSEHPMRSHWYLDETPQQLIANSNSRYGPVAPLAGLVVALDRNQPFAIIAKPCDLNAVYRYAKTDARVDKLCVARLAMVCGGQSRLKKSQGLLEEFNVDEIDLTLFRHRGYGNPGRARIETRDGRAYEKTYLELWADESGWQLETRCKLCPDALGEAADVAAADVWPGGAPTGEDAGFNGIIVRSAAGTSLVADAAKSGDLVLGDSISTDQFDDFQPHQLRKKTALLARYQGMEKAGLPSMDTPGLRLKELARRISDEDSRREVDGTIRRIEEGRITELAG